MGENEEFWILFMIRLQDLSNKQLELSNMQSELSNMQSDLSNRINLLRRDILVAAERRSLSIFVTV